MLSSCTRTRAMVRIACVTQRECRSTLQRRFVNGSSELLLPLPRVHEHTRHTQLRAHPEQPCGRAHHTRRRTGDMPHARGRAGAAPEVVLRAQPQG